MSLPGIYDVVVPFILLLGVLIFIHELGHFAVAKWLGVKVERQLNNRDAVASLGGQLQRRFPQSKEALAYERGNFND